ncbi:hypothetical protein D3C81_1998750 [compost metagenome]
MILDNPVTDGQPEPRPVFLRCKEWIKQSVECAEIHPFAVIRDKDADLCTFSAGPNLNLAYIIIRTLCNRFHCISYHIQHYLFHLFGITGNDHIALKRKEINLAALH